MSRTETGNFLKMHQVGYRLEIRKNLFTERVLIHWIRLVVESSLLEVFQRGRGAVLRDMVQPQPW